MNVDIGHVTFLVLLDRSATFDTVDHDILIHRLQSLLSLRGSALQWFWSYLKSRSLQVTIINGALSKKFGSECRVPQVHSLVPYFWLSILGSFSVRLNLTCCLHIRMQTVFNIILGIAPIRGYIWNWGARCYGELYD